MLHELVFHNFLVKECFPNAIKLQTTCLNLSENGLDKVDPELFESLKTVSELDIRPQDHIKDSFVLLDPILKPPEPPPRVLNILPSCHFPLSSEIFISVSIVKTQLLLLFKSQIQASKSGRQGLIRRPVLVLKGPVHGFSIAYYLILALLAAHT